MAKPIRPQLIQVFGFETVGANAVFWQHPELFTQATGQREQELETEFNAWMQTKRAFTKEELEAGTWQKIGGHGWSHIDTFHPDGTLTEKPLDKPNDPGWKGTWELLADGLLQVIVDNQYGHFVLYVIASRNGNTHSGVENNQISFKLIHS